MDSIGQDQHPDAVAEVGQRLGQGLAVLATLGEAAARLAAEETRRRERRADQADQLRSARDKRHAADQRALQRASLRAAREDRRLIAQALDPDWLARADLFDLATVWRVARTRQAEFPEARIAAEQIEQRLREFYPRPMDLYDQALANGAPRASAMRVAAQEMARTGPARPHDGRRSPAIGPATVPAPGADGFQTALAQERTRLAGDILPPGYGEELERLGPGGRAAAQALRETLATRAEHELRHGQTEPAPSVDATTAGVDEPATGRLPGNAHAVTAADHDRADTRTAAHLAAEWYPNGLHQPGVLPAHVASRQPANVSSQRPNIARNLTNAR